MSESNNPSQSSPVTDIHAEVEAAMAAAGGTMEQILATAKEPSKEADEGPQGGQGGYDVRRGRIAAIRGEDVFVDIVAGAGKLQGICPKIQFEREPRIGAIMDFCVLRVDEQAGLLFLSREGAVAKSNWDTLTKGQPVEARVTGFNKGGLELELVGRIKAFMPASQVDVVFVENLETYVGQKIQGIVTEVDRRHQKVMISRRAKLDHDRKANSAKILATIEPGAEMEGIITGVQPFGAFVDLGGVDGLIPVGELSHTFVKKVEDVVKKGDKVRVRVMGIGQDDKGRTRVRLSLKALGANPWDGLGNRYATGAQVEGLVKKTTDFGAFVELEPGIEGLVPISEISHKFVQKVEDHVKEGDRIRFTVLAVDEGKRQIRLSLKGINPWTTAAEKYAVDTKHEGKVVSIKEFGAFVELENGLDGMVHISQISDKHVDKIEDFLKVGDVKTFRVAEFDAGKKKISLSLKEPRANNDERPSGDGRPQRPGKEAPIVKGPMVSRLPKEQLKGGMGATGGLGIGLGGLKLGGLGKK